MGTVLRQEGGKHVVPRGVGMAQGCGDGRG